MITIKSNSSCKGSEPFEFLINRKGIKDHLRCRDDVSGWSRTLILVTKVDKFYLGTRQYVFSASPAVLSH